MTAWFIIGPRGAIYNDRWRVRHIDYNEMINVRIAVQDIQKGEEMIEQIYTRMEFARYDD